MILSIIGFIVLLLIGLWMIAASIGIYVLSSAFSGGSWQGFVGAAIGSCVGAYIVWYAFHIAPFIITIG